MESQKFRILVRSTRIRNFLLSKYIILYQVIQKIRRTKDISRKIIRYLFIYRDENRVQRSHTNIFCFLFLFFILLYWLFKCFLVFSLCFHHFTWSTTILFVLVNYYYFEFHLILIVLFLVLVFVHFILYFWFDSFLKVNF